MSSERSFSDREVSLVLRRAAEIESVEGSGGGVAESEILAIAGEAGIGRDAVRRALDELAIEASVTGSSLFPPSSRRTSRSVEGALDRETLSALVRAVEDRVGQPGTVTEALDTVRWTSRSSKSTIQVSMSSSGDETRVGVHERINDRAKRIFYILPTNLAIMAGGVTVGSLGLGPLAFGAAVAGGAIAGLAVGRMLMQRFSAGSLARVEKLAVDLTDTARKLGPGPVEEVDRD